MHASCYSGNPFLKKIRFHYKNKAPWERFKRRRLASMKRGDFTPALQEAWHDDKLGFFKNYYDAGEDWANLTARVSMFQSNVVRHLDGWELMTRAQIQDFLKDKEGTQTAKIVARIERRGHKAILEGDLVPHPNDPENPDLTLYNMFTKGMSTKENTVGKSLEIQAIVFCKLI